MASGALFGGSTSRSGGSKNLVEFKAGKMTMKGKTVTADKRKGFLYVYQSDDELMHLCWRERQKTTAEDDLIIFPDDIEYKAVPQCTTGRVYLVRFKSTNRKNFFWMQEPNADNDEELWNKLNTTLNNPPSASSSSSRNDILPELASSLGEGADIQSLLGNMDAQQMLRLLTGNVASILNNGGGSGGNQTAPLNFSETTRGTTAASTTTSTTTTTATSIAASVSTATATTTTTSSSTAATTTATTTATSTANASGSHFSPIIQLSDLQNILSNFKNSEAVSGIEDYDIVKAISPELLLPLLADSKIQERLMPFLPEGNVIPKSVAELRNTVHSPQFQQTLRSFSSALLSGQLGPLIGQFGLGDEAVKAAEKGDVLAFAKALQKDHEKMDE